MVLFQQLRASGVLPSASFTGKTPAGLDLYNPTVFGVETHLFIDSRRVRSDSLGVIQLRHLAVAVLFLTSLSGVGAQQASQTNLSPIQLRMSNMIPPTVTVQMGDRGGKFFGKAPDPAKTRRYYIAAEPQLWDYAPEGQDPVCGKPLPPPVVTQRRGGKVRYIEYTDETFTTRAMEQPRLGILGPVLRGVVGDFLAITFVNRTSRPLSMHPHGVKYDKDSEGAYYEPNPGLGSAVGPGAKFTYVWKLDETSGPLPGEPSSKGWLYHSHVAGDEEAGLGLVGFLVVTDPARARPDGTPNDIDREMASLFMIFDESGLGEAIREAAEYGLTMGGVPPMSWAQMQETMEQGERLAINGRIFGNLSGLETREGDRVRWYLFGLGSENDFHTAHWHGVKVTEEGRRRTDVVELLPASMKVADMVADNPGSWLFHCHVADHMAEGMFARFVIHPRDHKGRSKSLDEPFFGIQRANTSLQFEGSELTLSGSLDAPTQSEVKLRGSVTVFHAFSVFTQGIVVEAAGRNVNFQPNRQGVARNGADEFRVRNVNPYGVVYGGVMEFEVLLTGSDWWKAMQGTFKGESGKVPPASVDLPLKLRVGTATHTAVAKLQIKAK